MIETERLRLRPWREEDKPAFHALANTPRMMAHFGGPVPQAKHDAILDRQTEQQARFGHCMWAVEIRETGVLAGICGVRIGGHPGTPVPEELEIGWRIGEAWWGQGIAREAAEASIAWGWAQLDVPSIAAITTPGNVRSRGLMERLGMVRDPAGDFDHPKAPERLRAHLIYRIARPPVRPPVHLGESLRR